MLEKAGREVQIPSEVDPPLIGAPDDVHFAYAQKTEYLILTFNAIDFYHLHQQNSDHPGLLVVYQDNDSSRDMSYVDIVKAIANLLKTNVVLTGGFWALNAYRW